MISNIARGYFLLRKSLRGCATVVAGSNPPAHQGIGSYVSSISLAAIFCGAKAYAGAPHKWRAPIRLLTNELARV
ncbi:MAG: hypothetical protein COB24_06885 [Hyphomicrobiales bacterium]|nr:MAG: hypothetical protein COB24_06885 [Hyphomicrobiales bacterium]